MAPARRSPVDGSVTRTALLDAAAAVMLEEGYAAVTTRRLAQRAGVNNGLVSYYFVTSARWTACSSSCSGGAPSGAWDG